MCVYVCEYINTRLYRFSFMHERHVCTRVMSICLFHVYINVYKCTFGHFSFMHENANIYIYCLLYDI